MNDSESSSRIEYVGWMLLIIMAAAFMRLHDVGSIPPGLTHDEADHGVTAWSIVDEGARDIYFAVGYGREPLYDYVTALLMTFLGPTFLAGRLAAAYFGLLLIAGMSAWARQAFGRRTALLTAAGLAVGFWPVMASRQSLRSIALPVLFVLGVAVFWRGLVATKEKSLSRDGKRSWALFFTAGVLLGLTFYTYIPARILWIVFPTLLGYLLICERGLFRLVWKKTLFMLAVMGLVALPLLLFLARHPDVEGRIRQLASPLDNAIRGDFDPILTNVLGSLRIFVNEGDTAWRYNIAGRPLLGPLLGLLFVSGLLLAAWYAYQHRANLGYGAGSFLALSWLGVGLLPILITGPELSMTQAIGMQPVLYLFPALSLLAAGEISLSGRLLMDRPWAKVGLILIFVGVGIVTYHDYFVIWANTPQVRVQYETTMAAAMEYLNDRGDGVVAISSITPDRFHSPALAQMLLHNDAVQPRWFDARSSLLLPAGASGQMLIPGFTPIPEVLEPYFSTAVLEDSLPLRSTDLDRPLDIYAVDPLELESDWSSRLSTAAVDFGDAVRLEGYDLHSSEIRAGEEVEIVTLWRVGQALDDGVIFVHLVAPQGEPLAQSDELGVPSYAWQADDLFLQVHHLPIPADTPAGNYSLAVGVYKAGNGLRLPTAEAYPDDLYTLGEVSIIE